jgi:hypothetical protein
MRGSILTALETFQLDQHHEKIYADPNELIRAGFPASFLLPLIRVFESTDTYKYFCDGKVVDELIRISHLPLVYAIADHIGVAPDVGRGFTGRGFAMRAKIEGIQKLLDENASNNGANA